MSAAAARRTTYVVVAPGSSPRQACDPSLRFGAGRLDDAAMEAARLSCGEDDLAPAHRVAMVSIDARGAAHAELVA